MIVIIVVVFGLIVEMVNTAIEEATDAITSEHREEIKVAKDVAAGAMLIYALGAVVIAAIIFLPRITNLMI
jgi:diacylglycerol kinase